MALRSDTRNCSVGRALDILRDRWIFFIIREAFFGVKTYERFQQNLAIATNILSSRLKELVKNGIFERIQNPEDGRRFIYRLTEKGLDLYPVTLALMNWGDRWLAGQEGPPLALFHKTCGHPLHTETRCVNCGQPVHAWEVTYQERIEIKLDGNGFKKNGLKKNC